MTHRFEHLRLRLVGEGELDTGFLEREFPTIDVERAKAPAPTDIVVDELAWRGAFDRRSVDESIEHAGARSR